MSADDLRVAALLLADGATVVEWPDDDIGGHALAYAAAGWEVFPLHPWDCQCRDAPKRPGCATAPAQRGKTPRTRHGVLEASTDLAQVAAWWTRWPTANIGGRLPAGVIAIDIDPRHSGLETWATVTAGHGEIVTRTTITGRGDNGRHLYVRHPGGKLNGNLDDIGPGIDIKHHGGYTVLPPSRHALGGLYRWQDALAPIQACPSWLADMIRVKPKAKPPTSKAGASFTGDSVADWFTATHTWADVLTPHGWSLVWGNVDDDGSTWRHPAATSASSATITNGCLFVYTTNTVFEPTSAGDAHGYKKFRAFAMLDHNGNLSDAARAAAKLRGVAA